MHVAWSAFAHDNKGPFSLSDSDAVSGSDSDAKIIEIGF